MSKYSNIDVEIYEAVTQFSEVGADIAVSPRLWKLLAQLGLAEDLAKVTTLKPNYTLCTCI
jgi:salicylate hydroxylase